jgi:hypothetical protein
MANTVLLCASPCPGKRTTTPTLYIQYTNSASLGYLWPHSKQRGGDRALMFCPSSQRQRLRSRARRLATIVPVSGRLFFASRCEPPNRGQASHLLTSAIFA